MSFYKRNMNKCRDKESIREEDKELKSLLSQLEPEDYRIKHQIAAILYRYLEKSDRLPDAEC